MNAHDIEATALSVLSSGLSRRSFLKMGAALPALALTSPLMAQAPYRVGLARGGDAYAAAQAAIEASGEWPAVGSRIVVIKPNLVAAATAETGKVTDPEAVRAVVDLALADGAALILIVESSPEGARFGPTGFGIFEDYDPGNRVHLVDLQDLNRILVPNPSGWITRKSIVPVCFSFRASFSSMWPS